MTRSTLSESPGVGLTRLVVIQVILLTMIAPLATDMYVPAFPMVARDLAGSATEVQLTLTTFFVGMAVGQLAGGPFSDQRGRRLPLIAALAVLGLASVVCALSPSIIVMMSARFVQGFSGGWAMVIARAIMVDLASGARLVRALNVVHGITAIAPILGPLLGALILEFTDWRVSFWLITIWSIGMLVVVTVCMPETLAPDRRHGGGSRQLVLAARTVLRNRNFVGYLAVVAASMGVTFAYVASSAFVLQTMNGVSPVVYAIDYAVNAVGLMIATLIAARLAGRIRTRALVSIGLWATGAAGLLMLVGAAFLGMPLGIALVGFFVLMSVQGLIGANAGALASAEVPDNAGTGSAVLGFSQWCMAGLVAPVAGLGGERSAVPMAFIVIVLTGVSFVALHRARPLGRPRAAR